MSERTPEESERNKALARRWFDEGWTRGNIAAADEIFHPEFVLGGKQVGPDGPRRSVAARHRVFAELRVSIELQMAEGEFVTTCFTAHGRHVGEYSGVPATGLTITARGIQIWRVHDGLAVEDWNVFDRWNLVAQLDPQIKQRSLFRTQETGVRAAG